MGRTIFIPHKNHKYIIGLVRFNMIYLNPFKIFLGVSVLFERPVYCYSFYRFRLAPDWWND